jgi:hypothetical protein
MQLVAQPHTGLLLCTISLFACSQHLHSTPQCCAPRLRQCGALLLPPSFVLSAPPAPLIKARCCPQWTVGCESGSVGCCDPARPWQRSSLGVAMAPLTRRAGVTAFVQHRAAGSVYALFTTGAASDLNCLTIDASTGDISKLVPVKGPAATYFGKLCVFPLASPPSLPFPPPPLSRTPKSPLAASKCVHGAAAAGGVIITILIPCTHTLCTLWLQVR